MGKEKQKRGPASATGSNAKVPRKLGAAAGSPSTGANGPVLAPPVPGSPGSRQQSENVTAAIEAASNMAAGATPVTATAATPVTTVVTTPASTTTPPNEMPAGSTKVPVTSVDCDEKDKKTARGRPTMGAKRDEGNALYEDGQAAALFMEGSTKTGADLCTFVGQNLDQFECLLAAAAPTGGGSRPRKDLRRQKLEMIADLCKRLDPKKVMTPARRKDAFAVLSPHADNTKLVDAAKAKTTAGEAVINALATLKIPDNFNAKTLPEDDSLQKPGTQGNKGHVAYAAKIGFLQKCIANNGTFKPVWNKWTEACRKYDALCVVHFGPWSTSTFITRLQNLQKELIEEMQPGEGAAGAQPGEVAAGAQPGEVAAGAQPGEVAAGAQPGEGAARAQPGEGAAGAPGQ